LVEKVGGDTVSLEIAQGVVQEMDKRQAYHSFKFFFE
jgi:hypothetical protein